MVDPDSFDDTLANLADYIEDIGDEIHQESVPNILELTVRGEEYSLTGHRGSRGDSVYVVAGHPELRFVNVVYMLSLVDNLAADLDSEVAEAVVEEEYDKEDEEEELLQEAAKTLLNRVPREEMDAFESYCYLFISGGTHETTFIKNEEGSFTFFAINNDIYPYEDSFGISDFYEATTSVVSVGSRANRLIGRTIYLDVDEESLEDTEVEFNFAW